MIQILADAAEVDAATSFLEKCRVHLHATRQKNWDHYLAAKFLLNLDRTISIADLGCGDGHSLAVYQQLGFRKLVGIDLRISKSARLRRFLAFLRNPARINFSLRQADITATGLEPESIDFISCVSVVEHGVPIGAFARECHRILKPNGMALITTDYWHNWSSTDNRDRNGYEWRIQNEDSLSGMITAFAEAGLPLRREQSIPKCKDITVEWHGRRYTFAALWFQKSK